MEDTRPGKALRGRMSARRLCAAGAWATALIALSAASPARADFPYVGPTGNPSDPTTWQLPAGAVPDTIGGDGQDWKFAATPESGQSPEELGVDQSPQELCGIRGMSVVDGNRTYPSIPFASSSCPAG